MKPEITITVEGGIVQNVEVLIDGRPVDHELTIRDWDEASECAYCGEPVPDSNPANFQNEQGEWFSVCDENCKAELLKASEEHAQQ